MARPMPSEPLALAAAMPTTCFCALTTGPGRLPDRERGGGALGYVDAEDAGQRRRGHRGDVHRVGLLLLQCVEPALEAGDLLAVVGADGAELAFGVGELPVEVDEEAAL